MSQTAEQFLDARHGFDARSGQLQGFSYKLTQGQYGLDVALPEFSADSIDEGRMSAWIVFADGTNRDGVGDKLEVGGIRTERHQKNPIVLFDHGQKVQLPVALAEDPETHEYTVVLDPVNQIAKGNAFFYQGKGLSGVDRTDEYDHAVFCEQLFHMIAKRFVRAGSFGYQVLRGEQIPADYRAGIPQGLHLLSTLLLEFSPVVLPANADTVRKLLSDDRMCGKRLSPYLVKSLAPYAPERKAFMAVETKALTFPNDPDGGIRRQAAIEALRRKLALAERNGDAPRVDKYKRELAEAEDGTKPLQKSAKSYATDPLDARDDYDNTLSNGAVPPAKFKPGKGAIKKLRRKYGRKSQIAGDLDWLKEEQAESDHGTKAFLHYGVDTPLVGRIMIHYQEGTGRLTIDTWDENNAYVGKVVRGRIRWEPHPYYGIDVDDSTTEIVNRWLASLPPPITRLGQGPGEPIKSLPGQRSKGFVEAVLAALGIAGVATIHRMIANGADKLAQWFEGQESSGATPQQVAAKVRQTPAIKAALDERIAVAESASRKSLVAEQKSLRQIRIKSIWKTSQPRGQKDFVGWMEAIGVLIGVGWGAMILDRLSGMLGEYGDRLEAMYRRGMNPKQAVDQIKRDGQLGALAAAGSKSMTPTTESLVRDYATFASDLVSRFGGAAGASAEIDRLRSSVASGDLMTRRVLDKLRLAVAKIGQMGKAMKNLRAKVRKGLDDDTVWEITVVGEKLDSRGDYEEYADWTIPSLELDSRGHPTDDSYDFGKATGRGQKIPNSVRQAIIKNPKGGTVGNQYVGQWTWYWEGEKIKTTGAKSLRQKYRPVKKLRRRLRKSSPGVSTMWIDGKDLDALRKESSEKGLESAWVGHKDGMDKVRLRGDDAAIDAVAKKFGRTGGWKSFSPGQAIRLAQAIVGQPARTHVTFLRAMPDSPGMAEIKLPNGHRYAVIESALEEIPKDEKSLPNQGRKAVLGTKPTQNEVQMRVDALRNGGMEAQDAINAVMAELGLVNLKLSPGGDVIAYEHLGGTSVKNLPTMTEAQLVKSLKEQQKAMQRLNESVTGAVLHAMDL